MRHQFHEINRKGSGLSIATRSYTRNYVPFSLTEMPVMKIMNGPQMKFFRSVFTLFLLIAITTGSLEATRSEIVSAVAVFGLDQ